MGNPNPQVATVQQVSNPSPALNKKTLLVLLAILLFVFGGVSGALIYANYLEDSNPIQVQDDSPDVTDMPSPTSVDTIGTTVAPTEAEEEPEEEGVATNVKVYMFSFDKFNEVGNIDYTVAVNRSTTRKDVATFVIEQIIAGPTEAEKAQSLQDTFGEDIHVWFVGDSNCGGKDFDITIDNKLADVKFCKQTMVAGDMSGFIVADQIEYSLKQFNTIDKVRILNVNGGCFDDMSGRGIDECIY